MIWALRALPVGVRVIRGERPAVIWSTYPIATAHLIGYLLHRLTGLPWIADFRDSMTEPDYPDDPAQWRAYRRIERPQVPHFSGPGGSRWAPVRLADQ
ncbi:MAG: glycosyltransferase family 4 protein [Spiribacter salinus]|uniref:Glycosyltransferase family 4 protein n=1 Tax=Spiribacter salinus TaxID=1335746 RepID=A0A540VMS9_9GAMM|nr:MAG: glycosyltransferase family 4 protein [Spiribacter salinus]